MPALYAPSQSRTQHVDHAACLVQPPLFTDSYRAAVVWSLAQQPRTASLLNPCLIAKVLSSCAAVRPTRFAVSHHVVLCSRMTVPQLNSVDPIAAHCTKTIRQLSNGPLLFPPLPWPRFTYVTPSATSTPARLGPIATPSKASGLVGVQYVSTSLFHSGSPPILQRLPSLFIRRPPNFLFTRASPLSKTHSRPGFIWGTYRCRLLCCRRPSFA